MSNVQKGYELAKEIYQSYGIDVDRAIEKCNEIPLSIHCWQGDDICGFENSGSTNSGGIQATGNYPGKATTHEQLFSDLEMTLKLIPGEKKVGIHASYLETRNKNTDRNTISPEDFKIWADWAVDNNLGLDFNGTFFAHKMADSGYTLSSADSNIRDFWIEHGKHCRIISEYLSQRTGKPCVHNIWIPDGEKEVPIDTYSPRLRLTDSLNRILANNHPGVIDSVESKLFGIGSESYVTGSSEYYLGYSLTHNNTIITLDTGHFHPTETVSSKLSSILQFSKGILLHVSRPVRWDSDHVVTYDDELRAIMSELVRMDAFNKTYLSLDYFDGSINRIFAWVIGARNTRKAILEAFLQPVDKLQEIELCGDKSMRLAFTQELKTLPFGLVWDYYCEIQNVYIGLDWTEPVKKYEAEVQLKR